MMIIIWYVKDDHRGPVAEQQEPQGTCESDQLSQGDSNPPFQLHLR